MCSLDIIEVILLLALRNCWKSPGAVASSSQNATDNHQRDPHSLFHCRIEMYRDRNIVSVSFALPNGTENEEVDRILFLKIISQINTILITRYSFLRL